MQRGNQTSQLTSINVITIFPTLQREKEPQPLFLPINVSH